MISDVPRSKITLFFFNHCVWWKISHSMISCVQLIAKRTCFRRFLFCMLSTFDFSFRYVPESAVALVYIVPYFRFYFLLLLLFLTFLSLSLSPSCGVSLNCFFHVFVFSVLSTCNTHRPKASLWQEIFHSYVCFLFADVWETSVECALCHYLEKKQRWKK